MGSSKILDPEDIQIETAENAEWKKVLAARQASAKVNEVDPKQTDSPPAANPQTPDLTRPKSLSLGTSPKVALGDLGAFKVIRSPSINKVTPVPLLTSRASIAPDPGPSNNSTAAGGPAPSLTLTPGPGPLPRLRHRPRRTPSRGGRLFGSCFGGPAQSSSGKLAAQLQIPRKPRSCCRSSAAVPDSDANKSVSIVVFDNSNVQSGVATAAAAAAPKSPSCRCSTVSSDDAVNKEGPSPESDPNTTPMSKTVPENDASGISSGQQVLNAVLNAQAPDIIAAVQRADSSRQAESGVSPIRGLRPNRRARNPSWKLAHAAQGRQRQGRPPPFISTEYSSGSRYTSSSGSTPTPPIPSSGVARFFDSIIGRPSKAYAEQQTRQEEFRSQSRPPFRKDNPTNQKKKHPKPLSSNSKAQKIRILNNEQEDKEQEDKEQREHYNLQISSETDSNRHQEHTEHSNPPGTSRDQGTDFDPEAEVHETDGKNSEFDPEFRGDLTDERDQDPDSTDGSANSSSDEKNSRSQGTRKQQWNNALGHFPQQENYRWKKKDPYREAVEKKVKPDRLRRGYPDPSFNPRPGDIIIRARKRTNLRLTDFFYYDNENYMEQGDQILRAKFDYLPPLDTMYLWCRLYVYGADGGYTFLDSTSESVGKFKIGADTDFKTFKQPGRFA